MKTKLALLIAFPILASFACGKSAAEKFADEFCAEVSKCCAGQNMPSDGKTCRMLMGMGQGYNSKAGDACLTEMRTAVSAGTFCTSGSSADSPCNSVYSSDTGNRKPGETCSFDSDCAKSSEGQVLCASVYVDPDWVQKCQVRIAGKAGDACIGTQDGDSFLGNSGNDIPAHANVCHISDGLRCSGGTCVALTAEGGSCTSSDDCVRSAYCDWSLGKCTARVATGGTCAGRSYDNDCVAGSYCNASKQCTVQLANGATCTTSDMCLSGSCSGAVCKDFGSSLGWGLLCGTLD